MCRKHGKKITVMESLKGGILVQIPQEADALLKKAQPDMRMASNSVHCLEYAKAILKSEDDRIAFCISFT